MWNWLKPGSKPCAMAIPPRRISVPFRPTHGTDSLPFLKFVVKRCTIESILLQPFTSVTSCPPNRYKVFLYKE
jgi:hypothetical protein